MKTLLFLVLISACGAEPHPGNSSLEHERIVHIQEENGPRLLVVAEQAKIFSHRGGNVTLPCKFYHEHSSSAAAGSGTHKIRVKWTKLTYDYLKEVDVFVAMGHHRKSYGGYQGRVSLRESSENDASLVITNIRLEDYGRYKCEVIEGLEDDTAVVTLNLEGVVFPYSPRLGRYNLNFHEAQRACTEQDAVMASFDQLYDAWRSGLDWCNAGWLSDGSVQYPITKPREPCGGRNTVPGVRNYGFWDKDKSRYDVFCFTSNFNGRFYYLIHPTKLTYDEAVQACLKDGSQIAKVGQIFAAWKLLGYDRCDAGWLADGSVRYPISRPRKRCSPSEAAVRFVGFPDKKHKLYGVYCFRAYN
ncbi:hyaluronan and proteoglycan link protein 1 isoform X2 [Melozone crissalis]|uniref:hyaluronan and proteoglycan link protein 1 isoform X2 n=1 Tax=Melozone crissalis TaxID=40204 RepID=UPI0023DB3A32|nr:hyaluronan and proteoglycan link protein 1 isoform X2 [Melozone crissalis]